MRITGRFAIASLLSLPVLFFVGPSAQAKPPVHPKATPQIVVTASPNPVVETSTSLVQVVIQVEARASFAGDDVTISSTQLSANCGGFILFGTLFNNASTAPSSITLALDNDGNATVTADGFFGCVPGKDLIEASLDAPPYATAITTLVVIPPEVTTPGVSGFPANEVETGDGTDGPLSASDVYSVFYVETNPVYAEQGAILNSGQLFSRCGLGVTWFSDTTSSNTDTITGTIDNDGNSVFVFEGASCAAGKSVVIAEVLAGGPTYSSQYAILPPAVTV